MQLTDPTPLLKKHERSFWKKLSKWDAVLGIAAPAVGAINALVVGNYHAAVWATLCLAFSLLLIAKGHHIEELTDLNKLAIEQRNAAMELMPNPFEQVLSDFEKFIHQNAAPRDKKKETQH